ncbi:enoyl-CoA hydratase/isomerase family protein [Georgenia thermotolerans]|uniref:Enoyl-CoA hydratase n=1 Tax=Georgenia thermotolerans TaxID=527326 RepID=A0A7J5UUD7_9MICO|nr:enoyl-CoA hydratase/isomerase family protein [Georgenia thermotolerans]KAE8765886.1 enoyl-CoA hydratase [Georgenia thermotolerans]
MPPFWSTATENGVVVARYRNPPVNYYTDVALGELDALVDGLATESVRALVLAGGTPGTFVTHFSPEEILAGIRDREALVRAGAVRSGRANRPLGRLAELPFPVIAAMNGDTMGFGYELALACDLRVGQRGNYRYGLPEVRLGVVPGAGGMQRLTRLVGLGRSLDMVLRARVFTPEDAYEHGLVDELADDALRTAVAIGREIAALPPVAVAAAKRALHAGADAPLTAALVLDGDANVRAKGGAEVVEVLTEYVGLPPNRRREWLERR